MQHAAIQFLGVCEMSTLAMPARWSDPASAHVAKALETFVSWMAGRP
jgi:hypothetical protein